jgi:hypothetical protein
MKNNSKKLMLIVIALFLCITLKASSQSTRDKPVAPAIHLRTLINAEFGPALETAG